MSQYKNRYSGWLLRTEKVVYVSLTEIVVLFLIQYWIFTPLKTSTSKAFFQNDNISSCHKELVRSGCAKVLLPKSGDGSFVLFVKISVNTIAELAEVRTASHRFRRRQAHITDRFLPVVKQGVLSSHADFARRSTARGADGYLETKLLLESRILLCLSPSYLPSIKSLKPFPQPSASSPTPGPRVFLQPARVIPRLLGVEPVFCNPLRFCGRCFRERSA